MYIPRETAKASKYTVALIAGAMTAGLFVVLTILDSVRHDKGVDEPNVLFANDFIPPDAEVVAQPGVETSSGAVADLMMLTDAQGIAAEELPGQFERPDIDKPVLVLEDYQAEQNDPGEFIYSSADLDSPPIPILKKRPPYPYAYRVNRIQGTVSAILSVDETGEVYKVEIERSDYPEFAESVIQMALGWKFLPGKKDGKAVSFRLRLPVNFRLVDRMNRAGQQTEVAEIEEQGSPPGKRRFTSE